MRFRPILMSAPMVLATLADTKTVTRRLKGLEYINEHPDEWTLEAWSQVSGNDTQTFLEAHFHRNGGSHVHVRCPYGMPGDGMWVRENFRLDLTYDHVPPSCALTHAQVWYEADGDKPDWSGRLRPSIHLPREFSRLDLEQGKILPQRLTELTERDAQREGAPKAYGVRGINSVLKEREVPGTHRAGFWQLWDNLNPHMLFERNPWVWVINYKRLINL